MLNDNFFERTGLRSKQVINRDLKVSPSLTRSYGFSFKRGRGVFVWDEDNKKYLDFASGIAVLNVGHANPDIIKAVKRQLEFGFHCAFSDFFCRQPTEFIESLLSLMPGFEKVFLSNSGTEAVEAAFKAARWHSKKKWCLAFKGAFHGRTMGSLSLSKSKPVHKNRFDPFLPVKHTPYAYCYRCPFKQEYPDCSLECLNAFEHKLNQLEDNLAAVFFEPIQGEGGYIVPPKEFLRGVQKLCSEKGVILCADEVQSGVFRTGSFLASTTFGVKPDIVALAKSIGGGFPLGATIARKGLMDWRAGVHANTFGGNLVACAAGKANLEFLKKKQLGRNALQMGKLLFKGLKELQDRFELIGDVRGKGLMIGIELVKDERKRPAIEERNRVLIEAKQEGLLLLPCGFSSIRFCPPLIIKKEHVVRCLTVLEKVFKKSI